MAETPSKRLREETHESEALGEAHNKRQKYSYNDILSLLDSEEEEPNQDLSSLITTLQQELSSSDSGFDPLHISSAEADPENPTTSSSSSASSSSSSSSAIALKEDDQEEEDKESVIRHLLEASDDELGIPNREDDAAFSASTGDDGFSLAEGGLWELEDEAANYYALLQSELFM